jgi:hypothetical protein
MVETKWNLHSPTDETTVAVQQKKNPLNSEAFNPFSMIKNMLISSDTATPS